MKIKEIEEDLRDYRKSYSIEIDEKCILSFHDGESEDNTLSRNFSDCYFIVSLMKLAYEAGVKGEVWKIKNY